MIDLFERILYFANFLKKILLLNKDFLKLSSCDRIKYNFTVIKQEKKKKHSN